MAYGELKVDSITFTNGGTDTTVSVSGLVQNPTFSGDITVTGTISGDVVRGGTLVSGATVSGTAGQFGTVTGNTAGFTTVTGTTVTGTTANFVTVSGTTVTGDAGNFTTATITSGVFASGTAAAPSVSVGATDNGLYSPGTDQVALSTSGTERVEFGTSEVVFNDGGENYDFRVEGDTNSSLFFVDASADAVGIGTTSPTDYGSYGGTLEITGSPGGALYLTSSTDVGQLGMNSSGLQLRTRSAKDILFSPNNTERARIDNSGRLLVGTSSSSTYGSTTAQLQISGSNENTSSLSLHRSNGSPYLTLNTGATSGTAGNIDFNGYDGTSAYIPLARISGAWDGTGGVGDGPGRLVFSTTADGASSPTQRLVIKESGLCGFFNGTPTFGYADTAGFQVSQTGAIMTSVEAERCAFFNRRTSDGSIIDFARSAVTVGSISVTTTATAYNTSSDYRLKENVTPVTDGITRLQQLKPSRFNFIADPDKTVDGFLAHEVQTIVPEAITGEKDAVDDEGNPVYQGIDQSKLVPLLTAALQEAVAKIESLEARLTAAGI